MKKYVIVILGLITVGVLSAQERDISGTVSDALTEDPLIYANISRVSSEIEIV